MDHYMKWHMYADEDNLEGTDRIYNKYLDIYVQHPRTHIKQGRAQFTDYEIHVKTNHPEFALKDSHVRRRYSDFVWLENRLGINDVMMTVAPSLPGKRYFGRFKGQFLERRQLGLQNFLNKVVEVTSFLYDPGLHLFLQTDMTVSQMRNVLRQGMHLSNVRDRIIALQKYKEEKAKAKDIQYKSSSEISLKKTFSLDSFTASMNKVEENVETLQVNGGRGRGWSQYIGHRAFNITTDRDVTDFSIEGSLAFRRHSISEPTACVLPGGQLRLADDDIDTIQNSIIKKSIRRNRSRSWHGTTNDIIDLLLDNYDIVEDIPVNEDNNLDFDSVTESNTSTISKDENSSSGVWQEDSVDNETQIDISQKLEEYAIVAMPVTSHSSYASLERFCHTTFPGFHHSISDCSSGS